MHFCSSKSFRFTNRDPNKNYYFVFHPFCHHQMSFFSGNCTQFNQCYYILRISCFSFVIFLQVFNQMVIIFISCDSFLCILNVRNCIWKIFSSNCCSCCCCTRLFCHSWPEYLITFCCLLSCSLRSALTLHLCFFRWQVVLQKYQTYFLCKTNFLSTCSIILCSLLLFLQQSRRRLQFLCIVFLCFLPSSSSTWIL